MFSLDVTSSQKFQILIHHDDLCFICMFFLPNRNCFVPSTIYHLCVCVILLCLRNFLYIRSSLSIQLEFQISFTHSLVSQKFQRHSTSDLPRQVLSKMSKLKCASPKDQVSVTFIVFHLMTAQKLCNSA